MTRMRHPNDYDNPLLMLWWQLCQGSFFLVWPIFLPLISFLFTSCFIPSVLILLSLYFFNFLVSFFFKHCCFIFLIFFFSYSSSCHPISYCLNYELHIQSLSRTFNDCLSPLLPIYVLFKRPHSLLKEDWIFQGVSLLHFSFQKKKNMTSA